MSDSSDLNRQLERYSNETISAIRDGKTDAVSSRVDAYSGFLREFLTTMRDLGVDYSPEQASNTSAWDWRVLGRLSSSMYGIAEASIASGQPLMAYEAVRGLSSQLALCLEFRNHLVLQRVLSIFPPIIAVALTASSPHVRDRAVDTVQRALRAFDHHLLTPTCQRKPSELDALRPFYDRLSETYEEMLKTCVDHRALGALISIGECFDTLGERLSGGATHDQGLNQLANAVHESRRVSWFGLGAWLCRTYELNWVGSREGASYRRPQPLGKGNVVEMVSRVSERFSRLTDLADAYLKAVEGDHVRHWGSWILGELPEGKAHMIDFLRWLTLYFSIQGLRLTPANLDGQLESLPAGPHFHMRQGDIEASLAGIHANWRDWKAVIPGEPSCENILGLLALVRNAGERYSTAREDEVIGRAVSSAKVHEFRDKVIEGWESSSEARGLVARLGKVETRGIDGTVTTDRFGIERLYPKEAFVEESASIYVGLGTDEGRALGRGESNRVFASWFAEDRIVSVQGHRREIASLLEQACSLLRGANLEPSLIVLRGSRQSLVELENSRDYTPKWDPSLRESRIDQYTGVFQGIPVTTWPSAAEEAALVVDLSRFGQWVNYDLTDQEPKELLVDVEELDPDAIERLLEKNTELDRRDVQQRVGVKILTLFDFEIEDPNAAVKVETYGNEDSALELAARD